MDIEDLMRRPEGKTLEFKRDLSSPLPILRTACAFANTAGGTILFGIEDRTRAVRGIPDPLDQEERLASMISDRIHPRLIPDIEVLPWRDTNLIAAHIRLESARPYHVRAQGPETGTYVRVGSTNRQADTQLIAELTRSASGTGFDEQPMWGVPKSAIDTDAVTRAFAHVRPDAARHLRSLRLTARQNGGEVPTRGGILLFGRERLADFPDAWIHAARFRGVTKSHIVDTTQLNDFPVFAIDHAMAFVTRNTALAYEITRPRRIDVPEYPPAAIGEALINAVLHADYSQIGSPIRINIFDDRLEIENPGLLPSGMTVGDMLAGVSKVRNRVIARTFLELKLIERLGTGVGRMMDACAAAGLEPPTFEELGTHFRVTFRSGRGAQRAVDDTDTAIVDALRENKGLGTDDVARRIGLTTRATRTRLRKLIDQGTVVEVGSGPNDPQRTYFVAEDPARYGRR